MFRCFPLRTDRKGKKQLTVRTKRETFSVASLKLQQVSKVYGKASTAAVKALDMEIADGEIVSLLGSSGCGKTSTLRMIAGFESVSAGNIHIGTRQINDLAPAARGVAMAFEGYSLYPPLTVHENIAFALLRAKMPREQVRAKVQQLAQLLEISDILNRYPPTLSGGQQQRVSLARALARQADVYLLDEPMSQLEPQLRAVLRARIKEYLLAQRMTTVLVTHDQTEAMALSDRVAVMNDGVLQQFATPAVLNASPCNLFVASFIGEPAMNLLPGHIEHGNGQQAAHVVLRAVDNSHEILRIPLPAAAHVPLQPNQSVHLGVRAHHIVPSHTGDRDDIYPVRATLLLQQWQGDQTHWSVDLGGHNLLVVGDGTANLCDGPGAGTPLALGLPTKALHVFDSASGQALLHGTLHNEGAH